MSLQPLFHVGMMAAILSFAPNVGAQAYTAADLGTLGGNSSGALGLNDVGQVVGFSTNAGQAQRAFVWTKTEGMKNLGLLHPGDLQSTAHGINNLGQVVGASGNYAFLWTKSGMQDLGNLGGMGSIAYGINDSGQVTGASTLSDNLTQRAFLWTATGGMQDLGTLGGTASIAYAINDSGQVTGFSFTAGNAEMHAFIWTQAGGMVDLGTLGGPGSTAYALSSSGEVVGNASSSPTGGSAFTWTQAGGMHGINPANTVAFGVNPLGQVVGYWPAGATDIGFLWTRQKGAQNLNGLIAGGLSIQVASAINKKGQITGTSVQRTTSYGRALLLTPTSN